MTEPEGIVEIVAKFLANRHKGGEYQSEYTLMADGKTALWEHFIEEAAEGLSDISSHPDDIKRVGDHSHLLSERKELIEMLEPFAKERRSCMCIGVEQCASGVNGHGCGSDPLAMKPKEARALLKRLESNDSPLEEENHCTFCSGRGVVLVPTPTQNKFREGRCPVCGKEETDDG